MSEQKKDLIELSADVAINATKLGMMSLRTAPHVPISCLSGRAPNGFIGALKTLKDSIAVLEQEIGINEAGYIADQKEGE